MDQPREPILNVPTVVVVLLAVMGLVHAALSLWLAPEAVTDILLFFSFIPARYDASILPPGAFPGGYAAAAWSFVTYAFLHADVSHVVLNGVWLLAFGTPVAQRFGAVRFLLFFAVTAAAGAAAHLATHPGELLPMVGASAAISGAMAAAIRFVFQGGGPLGLLRARGTEGYRVPAAPLKDILRDPRVLTFLAVWFGVNLVFGIGGLGFSGVEQPVAWQAHLGGFIAGLIAFPLFDPVPAAGLPLPGERPAEHPSPD